MPVAVRVFLLLPFGGVTHSCAYFLNPCYPPAAGLSNDRGPARPPPAKVLTDFGDGTQGTRRVRRVADSTRELD